MIPKVTLFSITSNPLECIALGIDAWHAEKIPTSPDHWTEEQLIEKFMWLLKQPHQTPFEYVNLVWVLENCSRAFQQQLTRHRVGFSYSIQSLRVVECAKFADNRAYHLPASVKDKLMYHKEMLMIQQSYRDALSRGETQEDARGLLPLNVQSPITFACTYRALIGLLKQRLCVAAQEEWRYVAEGMRNALRDVNPILTVPLDCMCKRFANGSGMCKTLHKAV
jgi:flavin-dependent thymidylate synthase